jgi:hypothetical protein
MVFATFLTAVLAQGSALAVVTKSVVDLPTRNATQRFLYARPDAPIANVVFLPGSHGIMHLQDDGTIPTIVGTCAPFARNLDAFASRGLAVALVDQTSDGKVRQYEDVLEVARHMRARDRLPTVIVGGSASTNGAVTFAARFPAEEPLTLIVFGPFQPDLSTAARVKRSTLVIFHARDHPVLPFARSLLDALTEAPIVEKIMLDGGSNAGCGYHLFTGIDEAFVEAVTGFITRHAKQR